MGADLRFIALGTPWNISIYGDYDDSWRQLAEEAVRRRLERFERIYSRFRTDSLVSHIKTDAVAGGFVDRYAHDAGRPERLERSERLGRLGRPERLERLEHLKRLELPERSDGASERVCFPDDAAGLFRLYDLLFKASEGRIDPCAGADLEALGYGRDMVFDLSEGRANAEVRNEGNGHGSARDAGEGTHGSARDGANVTGDAGDDWDGDDDGIASAARHHHENDRKEHNQQKHDHRSTTNTTAISIATGAWATLGAAHHPTWGALRKGAGPCELRIPVGHAARPALDFGACGKGYAVDLAAQVLERMGARNYVIDASGDLRIRGGGVDGGVDGGDDRGNGDGGNDGTRRALRIALEDPTDPTMAVGVATVRSGSFCASGVGRRHWHDASSGAELHHILDAVSGTPTRGTLASWTFVPYAPNVTAAPIAVAGDGTTGDNIAGDGTTGDSIAGDSIAEGALLARDFPTAVADGLATALFLCDPVRLRAFLPYDFMLMHDDRSVQGSAGFPARAFLA